MPSTSCVHADGEERVIARHGAGRFLGELNMLTGLRVFVSARVVEPGEVIVVPAADLRRVLATSPRLGDTILAAFMARRDVLIGDASAAIRVVGSRFSPESLQRPRVPGPQPDPARVARSRPRRRRRAPAARVRRRPGRAARRDRVGDGAAPADARARWPSTSA